MNKTTNLLGFNIPNLVLYSVVALVVLFFFKASDFFKKLFGTLSQALGLGEDQATSAAVSKKNNDSIFTRLESDSGVKSQMNVNTTSQANALFAAMDGPGTNTAKIQEISKKVTGPNHARALYLSYRIRKLTPWGVFGTYLGSYEGNLLEHLQFELSVDEQKLEGIRQFIGTLKQIQ